MKNVNWRVKAVYLLIAAVLAIGLVPGLAFAGSSSGSGGQTLACSIEIDRTSVGTSGNVIITAHVFEANNPGSEVHPDDWDWYFDGADTTPNGPLSVIAHWHTPGVKTVAFHAELYGKNGGNDIDAWAWRQVMVGGALLEPAIAHNVLGTTETFTLPEGETGTVSQWRIEATNVVVTTQPLLPNVGNRSLNVHCSALLSTEYEGGWAYIYCDVDNGTAINTYGGIKYWGKIDATVLTPFIENLEYDSYDPESVRWIPATGASSPVVWLENEKRWDGDIIVNETVLGSYNINDPLSRLVVEIPADGAVVHWFVVDGDADVSGLANLDSLGAIQAAIDKMPRSSRVELKRGQVVDWPERVTVSGDGGVEGVTSQRVHCEGPGATAYIIAVATYPDDLIDEPVFAEVLKWTFFADATSVVPEVRWAGEKIVLEKFFGEAMDDCPVEFTIVEGQGSLFRAYLTGEILIDNSGDSQTVYTIVEEGIARVILESTAANQVNVLATVYNWPGSEMRAWPGQPINEHLFITYFLKLEDITLGNVQGEREDHDSGLFVADEVYQSDKGPWEASFDQSADELNISQDTLLRATVRGYFMGNRNTLRPAGYIDVNNNQKQDVNDVELPAGRWILPDDWTNLASADWEEDNPNWDIMDNPFDDVASEIDTDLDKHSELGDYVTWNTTADPDISGDVVAEWPVVGPYPNLDASSPLPRLPFETTIVPNGNLDKYDCPMPPALVAFKIQSGGLGYFKEVDKGDVYYEWVDTNLNTLGDEGVVYTNPFYALCIPANPWLVGVTYGNNGRYLWNTWDNDGGYSDDGWYDLWTFVAWNIDYTQVKVYSDNHGEAMVWLNGDYGYKLSGTATWTIDGGGSGTVNGWNLWTDKVSQGADVTVGNTTVQARALYPYFEVDPPVYSNTVVKDWLWGEEKLVDIYQLDSLANPPEEDDYTHKLIIVWLKDRDGLAAEGLTVNWTLLGDGVFLDGTEAGGINHFSVIMPMTVIGDTHAKSVSWLADNATYGKWWKAANHNGTCDGYAMAAIEFLGSDAQLGVDASIGYAEGTLVHPENNISLTDPSWIDPPLSAGLNTGKYGGPSLSVVTATTSIANKLVAIWWQDNTGGWHCYQPGAPAWANDLSVLNCGDNYCVYVSGNCDWNLF